MLSRPQPKTTALCVTAALLLAALPLRAQRHSGGSSPPTAPPAGYVHDQAKPQVAQYIAPVSSGLGAMEFFPVNTGTAAPQSLTRQLQADDERTRQSALNSIGVPGQYLTKGHVPYPHSVQLELASLSNTEDLDALLTVELDHHLVTAILMPQNGEWRRIGTMIFPTAFADPSSTPATFLRTQRSLLEPQHYRAVFHSRVSKPGGDFVENEAHLRILNNRAIVTSSFVSESKTCSGLTPGSTDKPECQIEQRWLQVDTSEPGVRKFFLVSGLGLINGKELQSPLLNSRFFQLAHLKTYTCQPFTFSDSALRYEPTGPPAACRKSAAR